MTINILCSFVDIFRLFIFFSYNTTGKPQSTPRSCASLDTGDNDLKKKDPSSTGTAPGVLPMKRQGSSTDGEAIKIVIDDDQQTKKKTIIIN